MAVPRRFVPWLLVAGIPAVVFALLDAGGARAQNVAPPQDTAPRQDQYLKQVSPGLLGRPVYAADAPGPYRVQVWEFLVGPGRQSEPATFDGALVIEVRAGRGVVTIDGQAQDVAIGRTLVVDEGSRVAFANADAEGALALAGILISGQPR